MRNGWQFELIFATALGSATVGGVFFAFSTFVMRALGRLPAPQGIAAMQSINVTVIHPVFMGLFVGTGAASLALAVVAFRSWAEPGSGWLLAGSLLYLIGSFAVTIACNVPQNDALMRLDPATVEAASYWARYL